MPRVTVDFVNAPKPGKRNGSIKVGDKLYSYDPGKFEFAKGGVYDIETKSEEYKGNMYHFVEKAQPVQGKAAGGDAGPLDRFWLAFVSNQTAHAISAGHVTDPGQLSAWAKAAYDAIIAIDAVDSGDEPDGPSGDSFKDDIPF